MFTISTSPLIPFKTFLFDVPQHSAAPSSEQILKKTKLQIMSACFALNCKNPPLWVVNYICKIIAKNPQSVISTI